MKISDACKICKEEILLFRDGYFETIKLLGKEKHSSQRAITFLSENSYIDSFFAEKVECVICTEEIAALIGDKYSGGIGLSKNPKISFYQLHNYLAKYNKKSEKNIIDETAVIHPTAIIEDRDIVIGKNTTIGAYSIIRSGTTIGDNCIVLENALIGAKAFYFFSEDANKINLEETGRVVIGNNVEIHPHVIIEKGTLYRETIVGNNSKLGPRVTVGHDCVIGESCTITGGTLLAGGVNFGREAFSGVCVTVVPNIIIGDYAMISSGSVVTQNIKERERVSGNFAINHEKFINHIKMALK